MRWAVILSGACLALFGSVIALYFYDVRLYRAVLTALGLHVEFEPYFPFVDLSEYLNSIHLGAAGAPVFTDSNPGSPWHYRHTYPIGLRLWNIVTPDAKYLNLIGIAQGCACLLTASLIAAPKNLKEALICLAAIASPGMAYAVERGNMDGTMFLLVVAASLLACRPGTRIAGYGMLLLAGLLKFYPLCALGVVLAEKPRRFMAVTALCVTVFVAFLLSAGNEVHELLRNRIIYPLLNDSYGAANAFAFFVVLFKADKTTRIVAPILLYLALIALVFSVAYRNSCRMSKRADLRFSREAPKILFLAGGAMQVFLFFLFLNTAYREILLLLLLPWLLILRRGGDRMAAWLIGLVVFLCWSEFLRNHLGPGPGEALAVLFLREPAWWITITLLISYLWVEAGSLTTAAMIRQWIGRQFDRRVHAAGSDAD